ncbi:MAG: helix-turn-helix transcriptional regulator [Lachnospiraceae bacterium]|nr:helix-turn-helix transcriptional regulator [Lachnospiraceae bacterium]
MSEKKANRCCPRYSDIPDIREDGSENIRYDNPDFPLFCRRNFIPRKRILPGMSVHWHSDVEFIYIKKGSASYQLNGCVVRMQEGEGIFVNSRQLHMLILDDNECLLDCIIFHPMLLCASKHIEEKFVYPVISNASAPYVMLHESVPWEREVLTRLSLLYELSNRGDCELEMLKTVYDIWALLSHNIPKKPSKSNEYDGGFEIIKRMIAYIEEHYRETVTLDLLCRAGGVGRTACTKLFQKYVNTTPIDYVRRYRIAKSIELLQSTDKTVTEIAYETGFAGVSFFAKTFKKATGITPGQLRKGGWMDV